MSKIKPKKISKEDTEKTINYVSEWYHCQSEIEGGKECDKQCDHCREYYKGTDNGR